MINIQGLPKADVLAALYDNAKALAPGGRDHFLKGNISRGHAAELVKESEAKARPLYFDAIQGRALKVDLSGDELDPRAYDNGNGIGAAARALGGLTGGASLEARK